jgi:hypothetical protein
MEAMLSWVFRSEEKSSSMPFTAAPRSPKLAYMWEAKKASWVGDSTTSLEGGGREA